MTTTLPRPPSYVCRSGNVAEALSIMHESARWLIASGKPLWNPDELTAERLEAAPEHCLVLYDAEGHGAATLLLTYEDKAFWPEVPANTSGFVHKLAVRRRYAGQGLAKRILGEAVARCRSRGIPELRLDCDARREKLRALYEGLGFEPVRRGSLFIGGLGEVDLQLYVLKLAGPRYTGHP